jgi:dissimilatory sulfite reductase (desulfoviridin) alpha/beta subunit
MKTKIFLIGLTTILCSCSNPLATSPGQTVTKWAQSVEAGHVEESVSYWDSEKSKGELRSNHITMAAAIQKAGGNEYFKVIAEKVNGEIAEVTFAAKEKKDQERTGIANLTKEKGEWKINSVRSK